MIKFKVWDKKQKEMHLDVGRIDFEGSVWRVMQSCPYDAGIIVKNDNGVLLQYTGLKDKNGNKIYDSDIVKHEGKIGVVVKDCGCVAISTKEETYIYSYNWHIEELEIIGNIYENPELLGK